ncbi:MAG TPA: hypothetical protein VFZ36_07320 [Vicinamibacterales bacterium]
MANPKTPAPAPATVRVPKRWFLALAALSILPWVIVAFIYARENGAASAPAPSGPAASAARTGAPGPWGRLIVSPIVVSPPLEYIPADDAPRGPAAWHLPKTSPQVASSFLAWSGMSAADVSRLMTGARPDGAGGLTLLPDKALIRGLAPDVRGRLYTQLAKSRMNQAQAESYRFLGGSAGDWFDGSAISAETRRLVEPLLYKDGPFLHFADLESVREDVADAGEWRRLRKTLMRTSTLLVRVDIDAADDLGAVAAYWGARGRRLDIRPLLESVSGHGDSSTIDVVHLLPTLARNHLYRYPKLTAGDFDKPLLANCLWSALNFFELEPSDRFLDVPTALNTLRNDYYVVEDNFELGDVVAFLDANDTIFHAAVYLADGLAFTKNGTSPMAPWTIMSVDNIRAFYKTRSEDSRLIYHRRKDL